MRFHALDRSVQLFDVAYIGPQTKSDAARVFYFQIGKIELRFAACEQRHPSVILGESYGESFANSAARTSDEDTFILYVTQ